MTEVQKAHVAHGTMSFNRRQFTRGIALAGAASFAAPAFLRSRAQAQEAVEGKITIAYLGTADQQAVWDLQFDLFKKTYPNIEVTAQPNPVNNWAAFFDTVSTQIAGGQIPDLIQVPTEGQRLFASKGIARPIDDLIERDGDELADFFADSHPKMQEWVKTYASSDGQTYYVPVEFNTMCIWYSTEALAKIGAAEPTDDWTWDDFLTINQKLADTGMFGYVDTPEYFIGVMPWLLTNGASSMSADWKTATINTPEAIASATFVRDLVAKKISPEPGGTFDRFAATAQGQLGMFGGGRWPVISMRNLNYVDKLKIVAWPGQTGKGSPVGWGGYAITKQSKSLEAAWAWVKFTTTKEAAEYFATQGGTTVPIRKSVATSDAFLANAPAGSEKLYAALDYATPIPSPDKGNIVQTAIEDTWGQILGGNVDPEEGLNELNDKITENL